MPDIIITPSSGIIDFFPVSARVGRIEGSGNTINIVNPSGFVAVSGSGLSINTSSPNATFHAYSATSGATLLNIEGTNGSLFSVVDNLSGTLMSVNNNAGLPVFEVFSDDRVIGGRFGQNDWIITSGGNVGIGTGVPSSKFHVVGISTFNGDVSSTGSFIAGSGGAGNPSFEFSGDTDTGMFTPSGNVISFATSGVERLRIDNIGRIGIGTTAATSTLQVSGLITANSGNFTNSLQVNGTGVSISGHTHTVSNITNFGSGVSGLLPSNLVYTTGTQSINGLKSFNSNAQFGTGDQAVFNLGDNLAVGGSGAGLFDASTPVAAELWSGTSSIIHYAYGGGTLSSPRIAVLESNGNVGIGTNSPTSKLHVAGDVLATGSFIAGSGSAANPSFEFTGDPDTGLFSPASNTIALATSGVERFRIGNNGNIGINYSAPTTTLQVNGSFSCGYGGDPSVGGQGLYLDPLVPSLIFNDSSGPNTTVTINNDGLTLHDFTSAAFFYTDRNNARIGIGTSTPYYTLHVEGAASFNSINSDWNSMDNDYWIQTDGAGSISAQQLLLGYLGPGNGRQASISCNYYSPLSISNTNSQPIIFNLDSSEKFRISNSGIGINTNNPTYQLHVNGSGIIASGLQVNGSLSLNGSGVGLYDTSVFNLGTISGTNAINCGQDRQIQTLTLNGGATTFTKGTGWPSSNSVARETTLNIFSSGNTSITWTIVNDWYRQPDSPLPSGRHIVLLRSVGSGTMQGHYIGNKTN